MKHSYSLTCDCDRCTKEHRRRSDQSQNDPRHGQKSFIKRRTARDITNAREATARHEANGGLIGGYE